MPASARRPPAPLPPVPVAGRGLRVCGGAVEHAAGRRVHASYTSLFVGPGWQEREGSRPAKDAFVPSQVLGDPGAKPHNQLYGERQKMEQPPQKLICHTPRTFSSGETGSSAPTFIRQSL